MNSQFSYELDERQIRILLQNAELDYNDALWPQFAGALVVQPASLPKAAMKFNLGLSRRIIVPAFFVVVICGLSALLFSFVDFRKNESKADKAITPAKEETSPEKKTTPSEPVKKVAATPVVASENKPEPSQTKTPVVAAPVQPQQVVAIPANSTEQAKPEYTEEQKAKFRAAYFLKLKKKKEQEALMEDMPSINASSLNANTTQPEPEIKLD